jgi:hypothetical protein
MSTKEHLTEQDLLEFQFKLASDARAGQIQEHLAGCEQCREQLAKLKHKFASLELLREEIKVSEDLVAKVVEQAKTPVRTKVFFLNKAVLTGIAAVLLLGVAFLISQTGTVKTREKEIAQTPVVSDGLKEESSKGEFASTATEGAKNKPEPVASAASQAPRDELTSSSPTTSEATTSEGLVARNRDNSGISLDNSIAGRGMGGGTGGRGAGGARRSETAAGTSVSSTTITPITDKSIEEQKHSIIEEPPPFAPASAIELVTLPKRDSVQLTIYNSADLTLAREKRNITLKQGWNWLQFMWANTLIDPTSLSLEPLEQKDKISVQQLVFPARLKELGRWLIHSDVAGKVPFEVTYLTSGLTWRAFYMGTLSKDEKSMQMQGYVRVANNSGDDYENAQTRLIVGQVHILDQIATLARQQYPYGRTVQGEWSFAITHEWGDEYKGLPKDLEKEGLQSAYNKADGDKLLNRKEIVKEGLSEYFLYTIEGTETIENKWSKRLLSFEANDIKVDSLYKYDEGRWGNNTIRFVKFANDPNHNLGKTPIPNGDVKIYGLADTKGSLTYIGGTGIKYIPVNEEVELNLGKARLVDVKPTLMDYKTDNYQFESDGDISGWDEIRIWKIEITNAGSVPAVIEITRDFGTDFWTFQCATPYKKYDVRKVRFELRIEPGKKQSLEYTVTTYNGTRQDAYAKLQSEGR